MDISRKECSLADSPPPPPPSYVAAGPSTYTTAATAAYSSSSSSAQPSSEKQTAPPPSHSPADAAEEDEGEEIYDHDPRLGPSTVYHIYKSEDSTRYYEVKDNSKNTVAYNCKWGNPSAIFSKATADITLRRGHARRDQPNEEVVGQCILHRGNRLSTFELALANGQPVTLEKATGRYKYKNRQVSYPRYTMRVYGVAEQLAWRHTVLKAPGFFGERSYCVELVDTAGTSGGGGGGGGEDDDGSVMLARWEQVRARKKIARLRLWGDRRKDPAWVDFVLLSGLSIYKRELDQRRSSAASQNAAASGAGR